MSEMKYIKDRNENIVLPITSTKAVRNEQGTNIETLISSVSEDLTAEKTKIANKADKATTLAGYGITDGYTKTEGQALETQVTNAIDSVQDAVNQLNGNEVVVVADHSAVTNPDSQKIYREQGSNSYTDWMYQDSSWKQIATYNMPGFDNVPTKNSNKIVKSDGVFKAIQDDAVFDVSAHNLDLNQNPTPYKSLALALAAIPTDYKKGGMSIKFIKQDVTVSYRVVNGTSQGASFDAVTVNNQFTLADGSSYSANNILAAIEDTTDKTAVETAINNLSNNGDSMVIQYDTDGTTYATWTITKNVNTKNEYVQYRFLGATTDGFTNVANWQGVDDEITPNSENIAKSGSVYDFKDVFSILSKTNNIDLCFIDKNTNCLVYFKDGHIITKNFDSRNVANNLDFNVIFKDNGTVFSIEDNKGNKVLLVDKNGNIASSNFLSKKTAVSLNTTLSFNFSIQDENKNTVLLVKNGHVITQNFNSSDILEKINKIEKLIPADITRNDWKGKTICFLGDSIIDQGHVINAVSEYLQCDVYNRGWGGAMITPTKYLQGSSSETSSGNKAYAFTKRFDREESNSKSEGMNHYGLPSPNIIDLLVIHGGSNDYGHGDGAGGRTQIALGNANEAMSNILVDPDNEVDGSSFAAALKYTCYKARNKYPHIPIALCTLFSSYTYKSTYHTEGIINPEDMSVTPTSKVFRDDAEVTRKKINDIIRTVAKQFGFYIIDMEKYSASGISEYFGDLNFQPTDQGHGDLVHPSEPYGAWNFGVFMAKQILSNIPYVDKNIVE